jgi:hypothetical protein
LFSIQYPEEWLQNLEEPNSIHETQASRRQYQKYVCRIMQLFHLNHKSSHKHHIRMVILASEFSFPGGSPPNSSGAHFAVWSRRWREAEKGLRLRV